MTSTLKQKKFCGISKWLEDNDPELLEIFRRTCTVPLLTPHKRSSGVTFLYPTSSALRAELKRLITSDQVDSEGIKAVRSLIINGCFKTAEDFKKANIIGSLNMVKYKFADGKLGGVKVKPNTSFVGFGGDDSNTAVWDFSEDTFPSGSDVYTFKEVHDESGGARGKKGKLEGKAEPEMDVNASRKEFSERIYDEYIKALKSNKLNVYHPYLCAVVSLFNYLKLNGHDGVRTAAIRMLNVDPLLSFINIIEPYTYDETRVIPQEVFDSWHKSTRLTANPAKDYLSLLDAAIEYESSSAVGDSSELMGDFKSNAESNCNLVVDAYKKAYGTEGQFASKKLLADVASFAFNSQTALSETPKVNNSLQCDDADALTKTVTSLIRRYSINSEPGITSEQMAKLGFIGIRKETAALNNSSLNDVIIALCSSEFMTSSLKEARDGIVGESVIKSLEAMASSSSGIIVGAKCRELLDFVAKSDMTKEEIAALLGSELVSKLTAN